MINLVDFGNTIPFLIVIVSSLMILLIEAILPKQGRSEKPIFYFTVISLTAAIFFTFLDFDINTIIYSSFIKINPLITALNITILIGMLLTVLTSKNYIENSGINYGEYYSLLQFSLIGMLLMVMANDLLILFVGLEIMSVCFYVLSGFMRKNQASNESALKYLLLGSFITGFFLLGIAFIYGTVGSTNYIEAANYKLLKDDFYMLGFALVFVAFIFKTGSFPLQMWVPDVYQGAPTSIAGMMSSVGKTAAFGAMLVFFSSYTDNSLALLVAAISITTMLYGNVVAVMQTNIKRILAYSSIAHAGYILVGFVFISPASMQAIAFYLISYILMQIGAFIIVGIVEEKSDIVNNELDPTELESYKGLGKSHPGLASLLTIFLFSLAGIPPLAGFWGKYYIFYSAIQNNFVWIAIIGILLSLIGVYYYIRIILYMWFYEPVYALAEENKSRLSFAAAALSTIGLFVIGFYPELIMKMVRNIF